MRVWKSVCTEYGSVLFGELWINQEILMPLGMESRK